MDGGQAPVRGETLTFGQTIRPGAFIGLSLKNALLNIVTLTLYRFWGKTEVRRRVWSNVSLNGEAFEYTGKGKELFLGFLLALVCLGLPYLSVVLAVQFISPMFLLLLLPMYIAIFALIGAAIFMTYRYMASRTTWRGVRFRLTGDAKSFGFAYLGYGFLTGITLGWYAPAMTMKLAEHVWGDMRYGDQRLSWARSHDENLYGYFAIAWIVGIIGYATLMGGIAPMLAAGVEGGASIQQRLIIYGAALVYGLIVVIASVGYHAAVLRAIAKSIRMRDARFALNIKALPLLGLTLSNMAILVLTLGFLQPVVMARTAKFLISRLSSTGEAPLAEARQAERGPKTGEGMADAFDVSPF